jgi:hypothetical protein
MTKVAVNLSAGLGNRLFQVAFIYGYGRKYKKEFGYFNSEYCKHSQINYNENLYPFLQLIQVGPGWQVCKEEQRLHMSFIPFGDANINTAFVGYFQNLKYFDEYRKDLLDLFQFHKCPIEVSERSFFIHIRRGDNVYPPNPVHGLDLTEYYQKALEFVKTKIQDFRLYVISDDINWCMDNKLFQNTHHDIEYVSNLNELDTLSLMRKCNLGGICANSTFSWWGTYMIDNPEKIVVFPSEWFLHPEYQKFPNDLYPVGSYILDLKTFHVTIKN